MYIKGKNSRLWTYNEMNEMNEKSVENKETIGGCKGDGEIVKKPREDKDILLDWVYSLWATFALPRETFDIPEGYILKCISSGNYTRKNLQLMGATCFFIAAKVVEDRSLYHPSIDDLVYYSDYIFNVKDMVKMEIEILRLLDWKLCSGYLLM